jgi:hypothetical protein
MHQGIVRRVDTLIEITKIKVELRKLLTITLVDGFCCCSGFLLPHVTLVVMPRNSLP